MSARVAGPRSLTAANVRVVAFRGSRPLSVVWSKAGPLTPRPLRQALHRVPPAACATVDATRDSHLEAYPDLTSGQLDMLSGSQASGSAR